MVNGSKPCCPPGNAHVPSRRRTGGAIPVAPFPSPRPRKGPLPPRGLAPSPLGRGRIVRCFGLESDRFERSQCGGGQRSFGSGESVGKCSLSLWERVRVSTRRDFCAHCAHESQDGFLTRPPATLSPTGGEGRGEGWFMRREESGVSHRHREILSGNVELCQSSGRVGGLPARL